MLKCYFKWESGVRFLLSHVFLCTSLGGICPVTFGYAPCVPAKGLFYFLLEASLLWDKSPQNPLSACQDEQGNDWPFRLHMNRPICLPCWNAESCLPFRSLKACHCALWSQRLSLNRNRVSSFLLTLLKLSDLDLSALQPPALCMDLCSQTGRY